jgi:hypothetical protein
MTKPPNKRMHLTVGRPAVATDGSCKRPPAGDAQRSADPREDRGVTRTTVRFVVFTGMLGILAGCRTLPAPPEKFVSYREFGWLGLMDVDAVSTQVLASSSGDKAVGYVDEEKLASVLRAQLDACGVPLRPTEEFERPFLNVTVAVKRISSGFAYHVDVQLYKTTSVEPEHMVDYSVWGEDALGGTKHADIAELNASVQASLRDIIRTFCSEYEEGREKRGRRTRG